MAKRTFLILLLAPLSACTGSVRQPGEESRGRVPEPETTAPETVSASAGLLVSARDAIDAGAASYVPKAQKAERLMSAVERVS